MKKIVFGILVGFLFVFAGCSDDDDAYSLGKFWIGFGMIEETSGSYKIIMDNDDVLIPVAYEHMHIDLEQIFYDDHQQAHDGERVLVNYTILDDKTDSEGEITAYYVKINSIKNVLMKDIMDITPDNADSIGNDPVIVDEVWLTDSLLNFRIKYWGRNEIHFINLVKQPGELTEDDQPIGLELRHNSNNDTEDIPFAAYVSFKLNEIEIAGLDSVGFIVTATDYDGAEFTYEGVYGYGEFN